MKTIALFLLLPFLPVACSTSGSDVTTDQPVSIIFDTDVGNDIDDALALDMLYKYMDEGKINLLGIVSSKDDHPYCAEFLDIMNTWYGYPEIPVGVLKNGVTIEDSIYTEHTKYTKYVCEMKVNGDPLFERSMKDYDHTPYSVDLMRKLLANEPDSSVVIITVGFSTNLSRLLNSEPDEYSDLNGKDLVAKKVKYLSIMGGHYKKSDNLKEFNIYMDEASAKNVFDHWPTSILASGFHVGMSILYPGSSILNDFDYVDHHPLVEAYKSYLPMPYDRPCWDLTSVLAVVEKDSSFFGISPSGEVNVTPDKFIFSEKDDGNVNFLTVTLSEAERVKERLIQIVTQIPKTILDEK